MTKEKNQKPNQLRNYLRFSGIAVQMGITIYLGHMLGEWLDIKYDGDGLYEKLVTLLAIFLSVFSIIRQVLKISND